MKVFLSWSGTLSHEIAKAFHKYLPLMFQEIEPFLSSHDIGSGERWSKELASSLDQTRFGLIFLTRDNLSTPWLLFEAGALTKHAEGRACSILIGGLPQSDVKGPLAQFQNKPFGKSSIRTVVRDLTKQIPKVPDTDQFDLIFDKWWPDIEADYNTAIASATIVSPDDRVSRTPEELLQEVLVLTREIASRVADTASVIESPLDSPITDTTLEKYTRWRFPSKPVSDRLQRRLLIDLDFSKYPTIRHLHDMVQKAWPALDAYSKEEPELFGYGTDYLTKALGFTDQSFRTTHGFARRTQAAFEMYSDLLQ